MRRLIAWLPLIGMTGLVALAGWIVLSWAGIGLAVVALLWFGVRRAHRVSVEMPPEGHPFTLSADMDSRLAGLSDRAGLAAPLDLVEVPGPPNAFALSVSPLCIAVSTGLRQLISDRQLLAVLAHELAHIRFGDALRLRLAEHLGRLSMAAAALALVIGLMAWIVTGEALAPGGIWWVLAFGPTLLQVLHHAASRWSEFEADSEAARLTGDPIALSQALTRIQFAAPGPDIKDTLEEFTGLKGRGWWRTHPPVQDRIDRLQRMAATQK